MTDFEKVRIVSRRPNIKPGLPDIIRPHIFLENDGGIYIGGKGRQGNIGIKDSDDKQNITLSSGVFPGTGGVIRLGGNGSEGKLFMFPSSANNGSGAQNGTLALKADGSVHLGGNNYSGNLVIYPSKATNPTQVKQACLHFDGSKGKLWIGSNGIDGEIVIFPSSTTNNHDNKQATILIDGESGKIKAEGDISCKGDLNCKNAGFENAMVKYDIKLLGADCAEEFDVYESSQTEPGTVMVISNDGRLEVSSRPYDKRVAGVISGGSNFKPGIILDNKISNNKRVPLAMLGKVYCKVDANQSSITVGDMLTTSGTRGHAMKVNNSSRAFGAVIGKALKAAKSGKQLIPILIALQ